MVPSIILRYRILLIVPMFDKHRRKALSWGGLGLWAQTEGRTDVCVCDELRSFLPSFLPSFSSIKWMKSSCCGWSCSCCVVDSIRPPVRGVCCRLSLPRSLVVVVVVVGRRPSLIHWTSLRHHRYASRVSTRVLTVSTTTYPYSKTSTTVHDMHSHSPSLSSWAVDLFLI